MDQETGHVQAEDPFFSCFDSSLYSHLCFLILSFRSTELTDSVVLMMYYGDRNVVFLGLLRFDGLRAAIETS